MRLGVERLALETAVLLGPKAAGLFLSPRSAYVHLRLTVLLISNKGLLGGGTNPPGRLLGLRILYLTLVTAMLVKNSGQSTTGSFAPGNIW